MKIQIDNNTEEIQNAHRLRALLMQYKASDKNEENRVLIDSLLRQLDSCLSESGRESSLPFIDALSSFWQFIAGPSHREEEISKQRREQLERAEHAETSAFEALAESADLKKALEQAQIKIHELESRLGEKSGHSYQP